MPFNGSGVFVPLAPPTFPAVSGTVILADYFNQVINDLMNNGLSKCITVDGQSVPIANLPLGGFKFTGSANGAAPTDLATLGQLAAAGGALLVRDSVRRLTNIAALRAFAPTVSTFVELENYSVAGDGGGGPFYYKSGAAPGTYVDNGGNIIVPGGGDGSAAWLWPDTSAFPERRFGAKFDAATDDTAAIQACRNACPVGGTVVGGAGVAIVTNLVPPTNSINFIGAGPTSTIYRAKAGTVGIVMDWRNAIVSSGVQVGGFQVDLATNAVAGTGLFLGNFDRTQFNNIQVAGGVTGIHGQQIGTCWFYNSYAYNQSSDAWFWDGELNGEVHFWWCGYFRSVVGALGNGFRLLRTTNTDVGGFYLHNFRGVLGAAGTITNGYVFQSTVPNTKNPIVLDCMSIADSITGTCYYFKNMADVSLMGSWGTVMAGGTVCTVDGTTNFKSIGNVRLDGGVGGTVYNFLSTDRNCDGGVITGNHHNTTGVLYNTVGAAAKPSKYVLGPNYDNVTSFTNDGAGLNTMVASDFRQAPMRVLTDPTGGENGSFRVEDIISGTISGFRRAANNLQIMNNAFGIVAQLQDAPANGNVGLTIIQNNGTTQVVQVGMGIADSGGAGYRLLKVPN